MVLHDIVLLARPRHWIKNVIVLFPLAFAKRMGDVAAWRVAVMAAVGFCLVSSACYVLNDIRDRRQDREHPFKKDRPLASGRLAPRTAVVEMVVLLAAALAISATSSLLVLSIIAAYLLLQTAYTFYLKQRIIVDVICIAMGFVLRAGAGAIRAEVSPWLVVCTFTICLFMGFCKRSNEIAVINDGDAAARHRATLIGYTPELLTHLITLSAAIAIISYLVYVTSPRTTEHFGTSYLVYTLPLVVYGICRFAMLSMNASYKDPTDLIFNDRPFQAAVMLWSVTTLAIILWGRDLQQWLHTLY